ncbi:MAG: glycosyltransferase family 39 protein [Alphaproteobacteria bacterium]
MNKGIAAPRLPDTAFEWQGFAALLALYILIHFALRLAISPAIAVDDVAETIFAQNLQWSYYYRQPPLYTWLLWGAFRVFGVTAAAVFLVKYTLVALGYVFYYLSAREIIDDRRLVLAAALSPSLIYAIGYGVHVGFTNTVLLTTSCAATFNAFLLVTRRGENGDYLFFGAALAAGLLSKWGFPAFAGALLAAGMMQEPTRRRLFNPRIVLAFLPLTAIILPFLLWGFHGGHGMGSLFKDAMRRGGGAAYVPGIMSGLWKLVAAIVGFLAPFWIFAVAVFPRAVTAAPRLSASGQSASGMPGPGALDCRKLLEHFFIAMAAIVLIGVLAAGVTQYKSRWMHTVLILFPLYFFCRVQDAGFTTRQLKIWAGVLGATALAVFGVLLAQGFLAYCGRCRLQAPYPELARLVAQQGFSGGTIVAGDEHIAGNFRLVFPQARVATPVYDYYVPPGPAPDARGQCLVIWNARDGDAMPGSLPLFLEAAFGASVPDSATRQSVAAPYRYGVKRLLSLDFVLLPGTGQCR